MNKCLLLHADHFQINADCNVKNVCMCVHSIAGPAPAELLDPSDIWQVYVYIAQNQTQQFREKDPQRHEKMKP